MLAFWLFTKKLNASFSLPTIITTSANLVNINQCYLFKQFKNVYSSDTAVLHDVCDSDTAVLHGTISKSDEDNVQF